MNVESVVLSWEDIERLARPLRKEFGGAQVYGVPRGGCTVAALVGEPTGRPQDAEVIVDDLIDSGATRKHYAESHPGIPFRALIDKRTSRTYGGRWVMFPWEENEAPAEDAVTRLLEAVGENPGRIGLVGTPERYLRALYELTSGMNSDPKEILSAVFPEDCDEMIVVRDIPFWSLCEHHLLPFSGTATVGYLPRANKVVGLSKMARLVECFARRLQVQERMTNQVATALMDHLDPLGAGCIVKARHTCMAMRGARVEAPMVTSALFGRMRDAARSEFLALARG
jgi:GTP cyclohydrolase I